MGRLWMSCQGKADRNIRCLNDKTSPSSRFYRLVKN